MRGLEANWNANSQHHYHLASDPPMRSTLSDANKRRPVAAFSATFSLVTDQLDRQTPCEGTAMLRLIDSIHNAIRLQLFTATFAYALLRIAVRAYRIIIPVLRFTDLVAQYLFQRRRIAIDKPPPINPSRRQQRISPNQIGFTYT